MRLVVPPTCPAWSTVLPGELGVACALSVISLLLIQTFFALLKSDHNDNYTSVTVTGRGASGRGWGIACCVATTLCAKIYVRMWSDKLRGEV